MNILTKEEMQKIDGGGISFAAIGLIAAGITFVTGVIDGFLRPLGCRE